MDKQRLTTLINQPGRLEESDFRALTDLKKEHPYFQAISPLITIGSKKYSPQHEKKHLQTAALYALDRKHLKEILKTDYNSHQDSIPDTPAEKIVIDPQRNKVISEPQKAETKSESKIEITPTAPSTHLPDSFFDELFKEMAALKAEKENYQKTLDRFEAQTSEKSTATSKPKKATSKVDSPKKATAKTTATKTTSKSATAKKANTTKKTSTTKKAAPVKKTASTKKAATATAKKTTKAATKKPKKDEHDIIEEITSRKELKINDAHKKEQLNIINSFIENEPILTKRLNTDNQSNKQEAEDLSANSVNLSDDVVSETLAKLMIKQGRKQKAIDIYKKLIWKFPQKKTYFVEIIDELKKES